MPLALGTEDLLTDLRSSKNFRTFRNETKVSMRQTILCVHFTVYSKLFVCVPHLCFKSFFFSFFVFVSFVFIFQEEFEIGWKYANR